MFSRLIIYRIATAWQADLAAVEEALARTPFTPCGPKQERSAGLMPPRGEAEGLFAESIGGQWILRFISESKMLPASLLNRKVQEKADAIERNSGRRPGKKEKQELKDEAKSIVRYGRHPLDIGEIKAHIEAGKLPTKLALTWDERVSVPPTEGLQVKKITFLDIVFDGQSNDDGSFDADVAIATGELSRLIPNLIEALGGEGRTALGDGFSTTPPALNGIPNA